VLVEHFNRSVEEFKRVEFIESIEGCCSSVEEDRVVVEVDGVKNGGV